MSELETRFLAADELAQWDAFVPASPYGSPFNESRWLNSIARALDEDVKVVGVFERGELMGGVAVSCRRKLLMPAAVPPRITFENSCQVLPTKKKTRSAATARGLEVCDAIADFLMARFDYVLITNHRRNTDVRSFRWKGWRTNIVYTYQIDLRSLDIMALPSRRRNQIRHAEKAGVVVESSDDIDAAHRLLMKMQERHGIDCCPTHPQLVELCQGLGDTFALFLARAPGSAEPVAMVFTILDAARDEGYVLFAAMDPQYAKTQASSLLYWQHLLSLRERGLKIVDMVGADIRSNAAFKAEFEGLLVPYFQVVYASRRFRVVNMLVRGS